MTRKANTCAHPDKYFEWAIARVAHQAWGFLELDAHQQKCVEAWLVMGEGARNTLLRIGHTSWKSVQAVGYANLKELPGLGRKSASRVAEALRIVGMPFADDPGAITCPNCGTVMW